MSHAWIGLGSNLGPREETLRAAVERLCSLGLEVLRVSHLYETRPAPPAAPDEPWYLNGVVQAETDLSPHELLALLHAVEAEAGRPASRSGPRSLDLDLLALGNLAFTETGLTLPHPRIVDRAFVLVPLCELDPLWRHPLDGRRAAELLAALPVQAGSVRLHSPLAPSSAADAAPGTGAYAWRFLSPVS